MTRLSRTFASLAAVTVLLTAASPALAQKDAAPEVTAVHKGAAKVLGDLKTLLKLTTPQQQKQWPVINKNLEVFLIGINQQKPLKIDLVFGTGGKMGMRPAFPVTNIKQFRTQNLTPFGIKTRRVAASLYKCKGQVFNGYMRDAKGYAIFAESKSDLPLPKYIVDPAKASAPLLAKHDMVLHGVNKHQAAAAIAARRKWFGMHRKELLALVKKQAEETTADYELRKLMMVQQTNEMERFYAESSQLTTGWKMNLSKLTGRLDLLLSAIPKTSLAKSIELVGTKPSYFAAIPRSSGTILSARANWPMDDMRKTHALELISAISKSELARIDADAKMSDDEKKAHHAIAKLVGDMIAKNVKAGLFDLFAEIHPNKAGSNTAVGGARMADGTDVVKVLELLPKTGKGRTVKLDVAKVEGVRIHKAEIKLSSSSLLKMFLGEGVVYIGHSKDSVWFASGDKSLEELTAAIKTQKKAPAVKASDVFLNVFVKAGPWLELRDKARGPKGKPELRAIAKTAFAGGKDGVSITLRRDKLNVYGALEIDTDVLRFAGAMISKFSSDTLDDSKDKTPKTTLKR